MTKPTRVSDRVRRSLRGRGSLGVAVATAREGKFTQEELAAESGISRATIANIERGKAHPRIETLVLLAGVLGVRLRDLRPELWTA